jgi:hypothetical protein
VRFASAAEQLPLEQVTLFAAADVGDVIVQSPQGDRTTLMLITGIQSSPITFESAQPIIEQYLTNVRNAEAVEEHLKQVRATATISSNIDVAMLGAATEASPAPSTAGSGGVLPGDGSAVLN